MRTEPNNRMDIVDSRDVIERFEELDAERQALVDAISAAQDALVDCEEPSELPALQAALDAAEKAREDWDGTPEADEHATLKALCDAGEGCSDWLHGATLIRDSHFKAYAQELAADIGAISPDASWPLNCIDWGQAADELKADYSDLDWDGVTYWVRA